MAIGDPIVNAVAAVSAIGPGYATQTNAVINEIIDRLEEKVPFSSLQGTSLDMGNVPITRTQYIAFEPQLVSPGTSPEGRFEYYGGNCWFVNASGAIQITQGLGLNASAIGGIGGDYGGANPASFRFIDASNTYEAYDDFTTLTWGFFRSRGVDISNGAVGTKYAKLRFGGAADLTFTFPPTIHAAATTVPVQIDNTGAITENSSGTPMTGNLQFGGSGHVMHPNRAIQIPIIRVNTHIVSGSLTSAAPSAGYRCENSNAGTTVIRVPIYGLQVPWRITGLNLNGFKNSASNLTMKLYKMTVVGGPELDTQIGATVTSATNGNFTLTQAFTQTVAQYDHYFIEISMPTIQDIVNTCELTYDIVV